MGSCIRVCVFAAVQIGFSTPLYSVSESAGLIRIVVEVTGQTDTDFRANISTDSVTATGIYYYNTVMFSG